MSQKRFYILLLWVFVCIYTSLAYAEGQSWYNTNLHMHAQKGQYFDDDGEAPISSMAQTYYEAGYDVLFHTPHSTLSPSKRDDPFSYWQRQKQIEEALQTPIRLYYSEEFTVQRGPKWKKKWVIPYLSHFGIIGAKDYVYEQVDPVGACDVAHALGGVVIVNHADLWEPDYWNLKQIRERIDGFEVYNSRAIEAPFVQGDLESVYLKAIQYERESGYDIKIAAVGNTDSHKLSDVLNAYTAIYSNSDDKEDILSSIRQRKTIAVFGKRKIKFNYISHLGEVIYKNSAKLDFNAGEWIERLELLKNGKVIQRWNNVSSVSHIVATPKNAVYNWRGSVTASYPSQTKFLTSGIWVEPASKNLPDVVITENDIGLDISNLKLYMTLHNQGSQPANNIRIQVFDNVPVTGYPNWHMFSEETVDVLNPNSSIDIFPVNLDRLPEKLYIKVFLEQGDELNLRNNQVYFMNVLSLTHSQF